MCGPQLLPCAALCALLLLAGVSAGRPLAPSTEQSFAPTTEPNVTAQSGYQPWLGRVGEQVAGVLAAATSVERPDWLPGGLFSGEGTAYSEAVPGTGATFACSYRYLNDYFSTHFAAINAPMWDEGRACGRCVTAWCVDDLCTVKNKRVQVKIVDLCPECKEGDVDFSIPVFRDITGMWPHRLNIQWEWSDCSPQMEGDIHLTPKDGINPFWQAFYFSNAKYPLASVKVNGRELVREQFNFWIHHAPLSTPAIFELEAVNGKKVTITVQDPLQAQMLTNF